MSSFRTQPAVKEPPRNKSFSGPTRRGELRISGPLPHPLPPDAANRRPDELYTRDSQGTSSASPGSANKLQRPQFRDPQYQQQSHSSLPPSARSVSTYREGNHVSISHAPQNSVSSAASRDPNMHRRRASTLRSVMRKLFGRKRHSQGDDLQEDDREFGPQATPSRRPGGPTALPEASHSPNAEARTRARRSHSLPSQDTSLPQDPTTKVKLATRAGNDDSGPRLPNDPNLMPEPPDHGRPRRRATLPSIVLSADEARELESRVGQKSTEDNRHDSAVADARSSEDTVVKRQRRRSRSANELRKAAKTNAHRMSPIQWRRYSDADKSGRPRSPAFSAGGFDSSRPETRSTVRSPEEEEREEAPAPAASDKPSPRNGTAPHLEIESEPGYDFGTLMGTMQDNSETGMAQRVATLEVKLMDLELAIAKLQGQDVPPYHPSELDEDNSHCNNNYPGQRHHSDDNTDTELPAPPPIRDPSFLFTSMQSTPIVTPPRSSPAADTGNRESGLTVRPQTSSFRPSSSHEPQFQGISVEQYSALTTLVRREQTARKLLESQITSLRKEIEDLRNRDRSQSRRPSGPDPGSFYHPSSPDSLDGSSSTQQRKSERERGSSTTKSVKKGKDDTDSPNKPEHYFFPPSVSNSSLSAGSERSPGMYRKRSTPDTAAAAGAVSQSQIPAGMI